MMQKNYVMVFEKPDEGTRDVIDEIRNFCKDEYVIHSSAGIDSVNLIISILNLIVVILGCPMILKLVQDKTLTIKFKGFVVHGFLEKLLKEIENDEELKRKLKNAYQNKEIEITGELRNAIELEKRLRELFEKSEVKFSEYR